MAEFDTPDAARAAITALERKGVEADAITLEDGQAGVEGAAARGQDMAVAGELVKHYGAGGAVGAVIGAVVLLAIVNLVGMEPRAAASIGGALAGGIAGFVLGGYWHTAKDLPVSDEAYDTFGSGPAGPARVLVDATDPDLAATATDVLREAGARIVS